MKDSPLSSLNSYSSVSPDSAPLQPNALADALHLLWAHDASQKRSAPSFDALVRTLKNRFGVAYVVITVVRPDAALFRAQAGTVLGAQSMTDLPAHQLAASSDSLFIEHLIENLPNPAPDRGEVLPAPQPPPARCYAGLALRMADTPHPVGTLSLLHDKPRAFSAVERKLLVSIATAVGLMLVTGSRNPIALTHHNLDGDALDAMMLIDAEQVAEAVNPAFTALTGLTVGHMQHLGMDQLLCLDEPHGGAMLLNHALLTERPANGTTRCRTNAGDTLPVEVFVFPLADRRGRVHKTLVLVVLLFSGPIEGFLLSLRSGERAELLSSHIAGLWAVDGLGRINKLSGAPVEDLEAAAQAQSIGVRLDAAKLFDQTQTDWRDFYQALADDGSPPVVECCVVTRGRVHWYSMAGFKLRGKHGQTIGYQGSFRDITPRKLQEERLRKSQEQLSLILRGSNDGAWDWDMLSHQYYLSPGWWEMLGRSPAGQTATPRLWMKFIHPADQQRVRDTFDEAIAQGRDAYRSEFRMLHARGHYFPVLSRGHILRNADGKPIRTAGTNVDLTEHYAEKSKLIESETRFKQLTELASDWYWEQDAQFRYTEVKGCTHQMPGLESVNLIGKTRWELPAVNLTPQQWDDHKRALQAHETFVDFELQYADAKQQWVWLSVRGQPRFDDQGRFTGYRGTSKDITQKKKLMEGIQEAQLRLSLMLTGSHDGAWDWVVKPHAFYLSERGWNICGYPPDEPKRPPSADWQMLDAPDRSALKSTLRTLLRGNTNTFSIELNVLGPNGRTTPALCRGTVVRGLNQRVVRMAGTLTDLTPQRQAQAQIRLLESCVESLQDVVLITQASPRHHPGPFIVYVNPAFERFTGYTSAEVVGKTPRILQGPETSRSDLNKIAAAMQVWEPVRAELANYKKNGELFWIELEIIPVKTNNGEWFTHWIGVQRDVTARKHAEQALRTSNQRLAMALDAADVGLWTCHPAQDEKYMDARWYAMLGYAQPEQPVKSTAWLQLIHPEDLAEVLQHEALFLSREQTVFEQEFRMRHRDGHWVWIQSRGKVLTRDDCGRPTQLAGTHMDVTPQVEAKKLTEKLNSQLSRCLEHLNVGVVLQRHGVIRFVNSALLNMFGYTQVSDVVGTCFSIHITKGNLPQAQWRQSQLMAGAQVPSFWFDCIHSSGRMFRALTSSTLIEWDGGQHILSTVTPPGDTALLTEEAEASKNRYEGLLTRQLEEKQAHIAHELHDSLGSQLTGISFQAAAIRVLASPDQAMQSEVDRLLVNIKKAGEITRELARGLVPVDSWPGAFWRALESLCNNFGHTPGLDCCFDRVGDFDDVSADSGTHLYRIAQEAIGNALRHGGASKITVTLARHGADCTLSIADNGTGFNVHAPHLSKGIGLSSIYARARVIGAEVQLRQLNNRGFCVAVSWKHTA